MVKDINPGTDGSDASAFVTLNGLAYFRANDGSRGYELWRTNGTQAGTELVIDLNPGPLIGSRGPANDVILSEAKRSRRIPLK